MLPTLSIVTPSFNQAPFIEHTIRSVLDQGYPHLEYQVMDGGSTDGTIDILRRYDDKLRWVSERDGGQTAAINEGFRRTKGDVIAWINSDDVYVPGAFHHIGEVFATRPDVQWICGRCPIMDAEGRSHRSWVTTYKEYFLHRYSYRRLLVENFISQPAVFFRRSLFDRVGGLDEAYHYAMDYDLWLRFGRESAPYISQRELARFRMYAVNKMGAQYDQGFKEELRSAEVHAGRTHPVLVFRHRLNRVKLVTAYKILARLGI
jgi:GT2 family glycosyltransferase